MFRQSNTKQYLGLTALHAGQSSSSKVITVAVFVVPFKINSLQYSFFVNSLLMLIDEFPLFATKIMKLKIKNKIHNTPKAG